MKHKSTWVLIFWDESSTTSIVGIEEIKNCVNSKKIHQNSVLDLPWIDSDGSVTLYSAKILKISANITYLKSLRIDLEGNIQRKSIGKKIEIEMDKLKSTKKKSAAGAKSSAKKRNNAISKLPSLFPSSSSSTDHQHDKQPNSGPYKGRQVSTTTVECNESLQREPKKTPKSKEPGKRTRNLDQLDENLVNNGKEKSSKVAKPRKKLDLLKDQNQLDSLANASQEKDDELTNNMCDNCKHCICKDLISLVTPDYVSIFELQAKLLQNLMHVKAPGSTLIKKKMEIFPGTGVSLTYEQLNNIYIESRAKTRSFIRLMFMEILPEKEIVKYNGAEDLTLAHPYVRNAILGFIRNRYNKEVKLNIFNDVISRKINDVKVKNKLTPEQLEKIKQDARDRAMMSRKNRAAAAQYSLLQSNDECEDDAHQKTVTSTPEASFNTAHKKRRLDHLVAPPSCGTEQNQIQEPFEKQSKIILNHKDLGEDIYSSDSEVDSACTLSDDEEINDDHEADQAKITTLMNSSVSKDVAVSKEKVIETTDTIINSTTVAELSNGTQEPISYHDANLQSMKSPGSIPSYVELGSIRQSENIGSPKNKSGSNGVSPSIQQVISNSNTISNSTVGVPNYNNQQSVNYSNNNTPTTNYAGNNPPYTEQGWNYQAYPNSHYSHYPTYPPYPSYPPNPPYAQNHSAWTNHNNTSYTPPINNGNHYTNQQFFNRQNNLQPHFQNWTNNYSNYDQSLNQVPKISLPAQKVSVPMEDESQRPPE